MEIKMRKFNYSGVGALELLTILFIGLKLTNYINWSWWLVLSPTLIPLAILILFLLITGIIYLFNNRDTISSTKAHWRVNRILLKKAGKSKW